MIWKVVVVAVGTIVAGSCAGMVLDGTRGRFAVEPETYLNPTPAQETKYNQERRASLRWDTMASTGLSGAVLAGLLGLLLGINEGKIRSVLLGGVTGFVLGILLVGLGGAIGFNYFEMESTSGRRPGIVRGLIMQGTYWIPAAIAIAVAGAVAKAIPRSFGNHLVASVLASVLAAVIVSQAGAIAFPVTFKDSIPPEGLNECFLMTYIGAFFLLSFNTFGCGRLRVDSHSVPLGTPE